MKVFLIRHAQTDSNKRDRYMGHIDEPIAADQQPMIEAVAGRLSLEGIERIYSSPLQRARDTAEPTSRRLRLPVEIMEEFNELKMAPSWEGRSKNEIRTMTPDDFMVWRVAPHLLMLKGQERLHDVQARASVAIVKEAEANPGGICAVFTHDAVVRLLLLRALDLGPAFYRCLAVANCSVSCLEINRTAWKLTLVNETSFLPHKPQA